MVGGTETISIIDARTGRPLTRPFTATVRGRAAEVRTIDVAHGALVVAGLAAGSAKLEIRGTDGALYDQVDVDATDVTTALVRHTDERLRDGREVAVRTGVDTQVVVALLASSVRVVDEGAALTLGGAPLAEPTWQTATIAAPPTGPLVLTTTLTSGTTFTLPLTAIAEADLLELQPHEPLVVDRIAMVCASALSGTAQLVGASWSWSTPSDAALVPAPFIDNCIGVHAARAGAVPLIVTADNLTATLTVDVIAAGARTTPPVAAASNLGDRAAAVALDAE